MAPKRFLGARKSSDMGRMKKVGIEYERLWGSTPVVDADADLIVVVNEYDIEEGDPQDPTNCAFSRACKRMFNSQAVMFLRGRAYIDLPDEKGGRVVKRFQISAPARELIADFDRRKEVPSGGFLLKAPEPSDRLDYKIASRQRRAAQKRKALVSGTIETKKVNPKHSEVGGRPVDPLTIEGVRHGTGMIAHRAKKVTSPEKKEPNNG